MHPALAPLWANREANLDPDEYRNAQIAALKAIPPEHPIWFHLHVGVRGAWTYPQRFAVDADLRGRAKTPNEKTDDLVVKIIQQYTDGSLSMDHLGMALQKLSRISDPEQFEWYRQVLEQSVVPPCSPVMINLYAPIGLGLYVEPIPRLRGYDRERLDLDLSPILIEEYLDQHRIFIHPDTGRVFDDQHEPRTDYMEVWDKIAPGMRGKPIRVELYESSADMTIRDILPTNGFTEAWRLPARIDRVLELWEEIESMNVNIVDRRLVQPGDLSREIKLIQERGYVGFSVLRENTDALVFLFSQNPRVELAEDRISLIQTPLKSVGTGSIFPVSPTEKDSDERDSIEEDQSRPDQR